MKKVIFLLLMISTCFAVEAQYKPYVSAGASLGSSVFSYGAELGIYQEKVWYAVGASAYENNKKAEWSVYAKAYRKVAKFSNVTTFATGTVSTLVTPARTLSFSPGIATVFNLGEKFAPQFTVDFPLYENRPIYQNLPLVVGLSINYWIK